MRIRTATADEWRERGIWYGTFKIDGYPVLVAVDSRGNERKRVVLRTGVDPARAARWLEDILDRYDPISPPLQLVKTPPPEKAIDRQPVDPRMEDHLSQAMRVFRRNVSRIRSFDD